MMIKGIIVKMNFVKIEYDGEIVVGDLQNNKGDFYLRNGGIVMFIFVYNIVIKMMQDKLFVVYIIYW